MQSVPIHHALIYKECPDPPYPDTLDKECPDTLYKECPDTLYKECPDTLYKECPDTIVTLKSSPKRRMEVCESLFPLLSVPPNRVTSTRLSERGKAIIT